MMEWFLFIIIGIAIIILDLFLAGIFFPIGIGGIVYGVLYLLTKNALISAVVGIIAIALSYYFTFKLVKSKASSGEVNIKDVLGLSKGKGIVKKILSNNNYIVEVAGEDWLAESEDELSVDDEVVITKIGVRLKVRKKEY